MTEELLDNDDCWFIPTKQEEGNFTVIIQTNQTYYKWSVKDGLEKLLIKTEL